MTLPPWLSECELDGGKVHSSLTKAGNRNSLDTAKQRFELLFYTSKVREGATMRTRPIEILLLPGPFGPGFDVIMISCENSVISYPTTARAG
jgi:hypothetical protein